MYTTWVGGLHVYTTWIGEVGLGGWGRSGLSGVWRGGSWWCVKCEMENLARTPPSASPTPPPPQTTPNPGREVVYTCSPQPQTGAQHHAAIHNAMHQHHARPS